MVFSGYARVQIKSKTIVLLPYDGDCCAVCTGLRTDFGCVF